MLGDVMVDSGAFVPCCSDDAFPRQSDAVEHARYYWRTTRHKYDKKNLLSKDANGIEAMVDRRVTGCASPVSSAREMAMGRYVMCGPACSKKCSGPDSMPGDARAFS